MRSTTAMGTWGAESELGLLAVVDVDKELVAKQAVIVHLGRVEEEADEQQQHEYGSAEATEQREQQALRAHHHARGRAA